MPGTEQSITSTADQALEQAIPADDNETSPFGIPMGRADVGEVLKATEQEISAQ